MTEQNGNSSTKGDTPFARLLLDYMWNHRSRYQEPMAAAELARRLGVSKQTVWNWLNGRTEPKLPMMRVIAQETGISLQELSDALRDSEKLPRKPRNAWEYIIERVEQRDDLDEDARQEMLAFIHDLRAEYLIASQEANETRAPVS